VFRRIVLVAPYAFAIGACSSLDEDAAANAAIQDVREAYCEWRSECTGESDCDPNAVDAGVYAQLNASPDLTFDQDCAACVADAYRTDESCDINEIPECHQYYSDAPLGGPCTTVVVTDPNMPDPIPLGYCAQGLECAQSIDHADGWCVEYEPAKSCN
jgi:hypothetical protein